MQSVDNSAVHQMVQENDPSGSARDRKPTSMSCSGKLVSAPGRLSKKRKKIRRRKDVEERRLEMIIANN